MVSCPWRSALRRTEPSRFCPVMTAIEMLVGSKSGLTFSEALQAAQRTLACVLTVAG